MSLLELLRDRMFRHQSDILQHIESQDLSLAAAFSPVFLTLFIYHIPLPVGTRILELFMIEGEAALIRLLMKMLDIKRFKIMHLYEQALLDYLKTDIVLECIDEVSLDKLLDH